MEKQKLDKDAVKKVVTERIRAGDNYAQTKKFLENSGISYTGLKTTFYTWKQELFPEESRGKALTALGDRKRKKEEGSLLTTLAGKAWSKKKQDEADNSVFASVLNEAVFYFVPCPNKKLTKEDVQKINLGGGVVGLISYYTNLNLNHPIIIFVVRVVMLVLKIKAMCFQVQQKVNEIKAKADELIGRGKPLGHVPAEPEE